MHERFDIFGIPEYLFLILNITKNYLLNTFLYENLTHLICSYHY